MRTNKVSLIIGNRGTRKTTFIKEGFFPIHGKKNILIVDSFDNPVWRDWETYNYPERKSIKIPIMPPDKLQYWRKGTYRIFDSDTDFLFSQIQQFAYNCIIIFEDATKYMGDTLTKDQMSFIIDSKQKNIDLVFVFHSLIDTPRDLFRKADNLTLFKTSEEVVPPGRKFDWVIQAFNEVQASNDPYFKTFKQMG